MPMDIKALGFRLKFDVDDDQTIGDSSVFALGREVSYSEKIPKGLGSHL